MAVVINGNGTVTGIAVGGLPDGIVDNGTMADDAVAIADLAATGTASATTFLRGDNSWQEAGGAWSVKSSGTMSSATTLAFTGLSKTTKFILKNIVTATDQKPLLARTSTDGGTTYDAGGTDYRAAVERDQNTTPNTVRHSNSEILMHYNLGSAAGEGANVWKPFECERDRLQN